MPEVCVGCVVEPFRTLIADSAEQAAERLGSVIEPC